MFKKKPLLITFEGIEGSGKTFHSKKLYNKLRKMKLPVSFTREPGGNESAEKIRRIIFTGEKNKFTIFTDTLLYLASRNENFQKKIYPDLLKRKIVICDRFTDATIAYQVYGFGINKKVIDVIHKEIFGKLKPDFTFFLIIDINKSFERIKKRKKFNRYDKFSRKFYTEVQKGYIRIAKSKRKKSLILDTSQKTKYIENIILKKVLKLIRS